MRSLIIAIVLLWTCPALAFNHSLVFSGAVESGVDITAPTFSSATINGSTAAVTLSEDVTITGLSDGDFVFTGSTTGASNLNSCTEDTGVISCTAADTFVNGETVTAAYTTGANEVEDLAGNDLASFSGETVTNNTAAAGDVAYVASATSTASGNNVTVPTGCTDAANCVGLVGIGWDTGSDIDTVTLGGNSCTSVVSYTTNDERIAVFECTSMPAVGSQALSWTWTGTAGTDESAIVEFFENVDRANVVEGYGGGSSTTSPISGGSQSNDDGDMLVGFFSHWLEATTITMAGLTESQNLLNNNILAASGYAAADGTSWSASVTYSDSGYAGFAALVINKE